MFQERPRGKGHAVRAGLALATGDFVLIQDADLEYDLNDYEMPSRAAACGTRRVRARRAARDGRPELEDAAFHRPGHGEPGHEPRASVLHRPVQSSSTARACATRSRCSRCSDATASTVYVRIESLRFRLGAGRQARTLGVHADRDSRELRVAIVRTREEGLVLS